MTIDSGETVTILSSEEASDWPLIGPETQALGETPDVVRLGAGFGDVVSQARVVLRRAIGRAIRTDEPGDVGLATGYVQSGKTLSFTTVCALARDNGIPLVIVITGISTPLFKQSNERLQRDLRLLTRSDRKWLHIPIDTQSPPPTQRIVDTLYDWTDTGVPDARRQTLLITVMKNHRHLDFLVRHLAPVSLAGVPTLIIDDEGDQASLNYLINRGRESTTYRQIGSLRRALPKHAYVQYTATPQAPLLINIIDALSPSFAEVLRPGAGYTGGDRFFPSPGVQPLIRTIPASEIVAPGHAIGAPPATFRQALATFFVGVVVGEQRDSAEGNRSMLVHPHQTTGLHNDYYVWAESLRADWQRALQASEGDESRTLILALFRSAYDDLSATESDLPPFDVIVSELERAIRRTSIQEVNSVRGRTPSIPWRDKYAHILVGGQAMDRGFTVEGLTVTYMPRGLGEGNADTVQQRARFFGYKSRYLGLCRVWLEGGVRTAFQDYVEHEESMRAGLARHAATRLPLRDWKRAFFLDQALRPTRRQVVSVAFTRGNHGQRWVDPTRPHELPAAIQHNNDLISRFSDGLTFVDDDGDSRRTEAQRHKVAIGVPLGRALEFLQDLQMPAPADSLEHTALLLQLDKWLKDHEDSTCSIYLMRPSGGDRIRSRNEDDDLPNFHQGPNPGTGYPGDRAIRHPTDVTIQLHTFDLLAHRDAEDQTTYPGVRIASTFVPLTVGRDWLVQ